MSTGPDTDADPLASIRFTPVERITLATLLKRADEQGVSLSALVADMIMRVLRGQATTEEWMFVKRTFEADFILAVAMVNGVKRIKVEVE